MNEKVSYKAYVGESIFDTIIRASQMATEVGRDVLIAFNDTKVTVCPNQDNNDGYANTLNRWRLQNPKTERNTVNFFN